MTAVAGVALARNETPATAAAPRQVDNFRLTDNNGFAQDLRRLVDVKAIVIVSQLNGDAGSRKAGRELEALKKAHPDMAFFMVNSAAADGRDAIAAEAKTQGYTFPVLRDDLQLVGEQLGISYAGEAYVVEPKTLKVLYHGPVAGAAKAGSLAAALTDVSVGRTIAAADVAGKGTPIAFPERSRQAQHQAISYTKDIAPMLEAKCVTCHQTGGIGPFAMTNYQTVKGYAPMIREAIRTRTMPPWHPDPAFGKFEHDEGLSPAQITTLVHWVEAGAPRGEGDDPLAAQTRTAPEWPLGQPDLVINVPAYTIPASGVVEYQFPTAANPLTEGRWVKAAALMPGDRRGTHHILSGYISGTPKQGAASSTQWEASYGEYAVGGEAFELPPKVGIMLPAGGAMGFQMHYTPYGKEAVDSSKMGFYFYPKGQEPDRIMRHLVIANVLLEIPPGDDNHMETTYTTFPKEALLYSAFLHTHYRGKAGRLEMVTADGTRQTLINLPRYDFNWQRTYTFSDPIKVPAGAKIVATYWYDNSVRNSANPNPAKTITWGPQSWEEMHYTSLYFQWADETVAKPADATPKMSGIPVQMMGMLDTNLDGKVASDELHGRVNAALKPHFAELDTDKDGFLNGAELAGGLKFLMPLVNSSSAHSPTP
jgi:mono/diheme cytochrome c family protein